MNRGNVGSPERRRWALAVLLVPAATLLVFIILVGISARGLSLGDSSAGSIRLQDARLRQDENDHWQLTAEAFIELPEPIRVGLDSGVPLDFILTLDFRQPRSFLPDRVLASLSHRFRLSYYELTRHYRVYAVDTDSSRNFRSLSAALAGLGDIDRLPLSITPDEDLQDEQTLSERIANAETSVEAVLDFRLDSNSLPLPLQPLIASSWRLSSKEYHWLVN